MREVAHCKTEHAHGSQVCVVLSYCSNEDAEMPSCSDVPRSGRVVPAIVELLVNPVDPVSGGGEAEDFPCETPATCHFDLLYNAQPLECVRHFSRDRRSWLLGGA
ncbi:hypothetical protein M3J09_004952 [Ascochyta lentis]